MHKASAVQSMCGIWHAAWQPAVFDSHGCQPCFPALCLLQGGALSRGKHASLAHTHSGLSLCKAAQSLSQLSHLVCLMLMCVCALLACLHWQPEESAAVDRA